MVTPRSDHLRMPRSRFLIASVLMLVAACGQESDPGGRAGPPYLAIVNKLDIPAGITAGARYTFQVTEISGTTGIDTTIRAAPTDTIILSVVPATYRITVDSLPTNCSMRDGPEQFVLVPEGANTAVARFQVICSSPLVIETGTDGAGADDQYYVRLSGGGIAERFLIIGGNDTLRVDSLPGGAYEVELGAIAPNCDVTSDGRERRRLELAAQGGARVSFRVRCSDPARRPSVVRYESGMQDGGFAFYVIGADPDRDIERYTYDVTDCDGNSLIPRGPRTRRGLSSGRTSRADTLTVIGAFELGISAGTTPMCASLRLEDEQGNTTSWIDRRLGLSPGGAAPVFVSAGLGFVGTSLIQVSVAVADLDDDFVGLFPLARLSDGALGAPDGQPDIGAFNAAGYLAPPLPDVPLGNGRPGLADYHAIILYGIDLRGNVTRRELPIF
jgi:hypothetical protein